MDGESTAAKLSSQGTQLFAAAVRLRVVVDPSSVQQTRGLLVNMRIRSENGEKNRNVSVPLGLAIKRAAQLSFPEAFRGKNRSQLGLPVAA